MSKKLIGLAILLCSVTYAFSQKEDTYPIDKQLKACLDSGQNETTSRMVGCTADAERAWDAEMNKYYKLLQGVLSSEEKAKLKEAQLKWLAFRDAETVAVEKIYDDMGGTMWRIAEVNAEMELVKQRALELKAYYGDLTAGK